MTTSTTPGVLEVITGPMFSGKSEELIRRLKRARIARQRVACYKPDIDLRFHRTAIASHSQQTHDAVPVTGVEDLRAHLFPQLAQVEVVGIDEVQFLSPDVISLAAELVALGKRVLLAGLDMTFSAEPFGPVPALMAMADKVTKLSAVCMVCGASAIHTQRLSGSQELVVVGAAGLYEARCRAHFTPHIDEHGSEQLEFPCCPDPLKTLRKFVDTRRAPEYRVRMRNRALLVSAALLCLSACANLDEITQLHGVAEQARVALPRVSSDFYTSCERRAAILVRIPADQLPANLAGITPDCKPYKALAEHLAVDQTVLVDYLDALARLASDKPMTYGKTLDADIGAIGGLSPAAGANADIAADAQKASAAALGLSKQLASFATQHYREKEIRKLVTGSDDSVQQLTKALSTVVVNDYGIVLDSETAYLKAYYGGPMAAPSQREPLALMLVQRQYDGDVSRVREHREASAAYGRVMSDVATLHGKLAAAARDSAGFDKKLEALSPDFDNLRDAVAALLVEVK